MATNKNILPALTPKNQEVKKKFILKEIWTGNALNTGVSTPVIPTWASKLFEKCGGGVRVWRQTAPLLLSHPLPLELRQQCQTPMQELSRFFCEKLNISRKYLVIQMFRGFLNKKLFVTRALCIMFPINKICLNIWFFQKGFQDWITHVGKKIIITLWEWGCNGI